MNDYTANFIKNTENTYFYNILFCNVGNNDKSIICFEHISYNFISSYDIICEYTYPSNNIESFLKPG